MLGSKGGGRGGGRAQGGLKVDKMHPCVMCGVCSRQGADDGLMWLWANLDVNRWSFIVCRTSRVRFTHVQ